MDKKLYRSNTDKVLLGVCGGLAEFFGLNSVLIRILWLLAVCLFGTGILAYIICAIVMPKQR
ncbi:MAG: PspC domain-containing protein [Oscillospiraceae bacterium]|nr:PspC domain-containing protein [Oscillospiraceae bacterium]